MKRGMAILLSMCVLATVGYFTASIIDRFLDDDTPPGTVESDKPDKDGSDQMALSLPP
jgi:hypothetical protein